MVGLFHYIVVDASSRLDSATRLVSNLSEKVLLVAHADVASLWSAGRVAQYLGESGSRDRFALVLNRYRKVAGFDEARNRGRHRSAGSLANPQSVLSRYRQPSIVAFPWCSRGTREFARSISGLAQHLTKDDLDVKRAAWSLFKTV